VLWADLLLQGAGLTQQMGSLNPLPSTLHPDVIVIGAGQAGLAVGYYLRRTGLSFTLLDTEEGPGGAWRRTWDSLTLFSPASASSLPGWLFPPSADDYPTRDEALGYLAAYERRYQLPVERPIRVSAVRRADAGFEIETDEGIRRARAVVSATGTWAKAVVPDVPGRDIFRGEQFHSAQYSSPARLGGKRVVIVGAGNSGAQLVAELSRIANVTWATRAAPSFLADHIDGRYLFREESAVYAAKTAGHPTPPISLGDIVMVPSVRDARDRGALEALPMFTAMTERGVIWPDGREESVDAVIWCTGFQPALAHLAPLGVVEPTGRVRTVGTRSLVEPRLWLVGYGNWTGFASATMIGVGRTARETVNQIVAELTPAERTLERPHREASLGLASSEANSRSGLHH
jgi:cation diffusion facilitator CzcD-associated flavoprotein CzcO